MFPKVIADFVDDLRQALDIAVEILAPLRWEVTDGFGIFPHNLQELLAS